MPGERLQLQRGERVLNTKMVPSVMVRFADDFEAYIPLPSEVTGNDNLHQLYE